MRGISQLSGRWVLLALLAAAGLSVAETRSPRALQLATQSTSVPTAPAWQIDDLHGQPHRLSDYRHHWLLVHFWAAWCGPCRQELPSLARAANQLDGKLAIVAIDVGDPRRHIRQATAGMQLPFPILEDSDSRVSSAWRVQGLPTTYLVDPGGHIVGGVRGAQTWDEPPLLDNLRSLVKTPMRATR